jgi:hypothetical protein
MKSKSFKITGPQLAALRLAEKDGSLILGGLDATPGLSKRVVWNLYNKGWLQWHSGSHQRHASEWLLTDAGRKVLAENEAC